MYILTATYFRYFVLLNYIIKNIIVEIYFINMFSNTFTEKTVGLVIFDYLLNIGPKWWNETILRQIYLLWAIVGFHLS